MEYKIEHDSMGEVKVPADKYWEMLQFEGCLEVMLNMLSFP